MISKEALGVLALGIMISNGAILFAVFFGTPVGTSVLSWIGGAVLGMGTIMALVDAS